jgi:SWI/SNF-related matrix-associated actin-dependent regulator of chromatin subfamily A3
LLTILCSYQHVLTGAKRSQQDEAKGGILADDMGLGKTLVMLATIAGSIDRGDEFIRTEKREALENPQPTVPSKATLIVAPSSCTYENSQAAKCLLFMYLLWQFLTFF